jgi:protein TonB
MYQSRSQGARQVLGTGLLVGAIQLSIGAALLAAFAGGTFDRMIHPTLKDNAWIPIPPLPKPTVQPVHRSAPNRNMMTAPTPTIPDLAPPTPLTLGPLAPLPPVAGDDRGFLTDFPEPGHFPEPGPGPTVPAIGARPLGDASHWITPGDYPSRALREGWSGVTRLHLVIGSDGRVNRCTVVASSGHDTLDAVACEKVSQRARFSPARDGSGTNREGTYDSAIHWEINAE